MWQLRKGNWLFRSRKKVKMKFIYLDDAGNNKLFDWLLSSLACWLMLARRLCVYSVGFKVDASQEIFNVGMMSYYKKVCSCKRHTVVHCAFCFWQFALLFLGLMTHYRYTSPCVLVHCFACACNRTLHRMHVCIASRVGRTLHTDNC